MTREDKDLLLKDFSARLPYGVKVGTLDNDGSLENIWEVLWYNTFTEDIKLINSIDVADKLIDISEIKPYLFPLSSMTEEQSKELEEIDPEFYSLICGNGDIYVSMDVRGYDWLNKNHFDYRGLIPMGLAIDCTNLNIY